MMRDDLILVFDLLCLILPAPEIGKRQKQVFLMDFFHCVYQGDV